MLMTTEQARRTWCPMVRLASINPTGGVEGGQTVMNRLQNGNMTACPDSSMCIADKCAMWRWEPKYGTTPPAKLGGLMPVTPRLEPTHGYCGLAGRPV